MTTRTKKTAAIATAAVALTSGAYALGSQAGDGGALASGSRVSAAGNTATGATAIATTTNSNGPRVRAFGHRGGPGRGFGLDTIASKLGVSTTALQTALKAIRDEKTPQQRRTDFINALAAALGKPADQVTSAANSVLPDRGAGRPADHRGDFAAALAKALGVQQAKVQAGLDKLRRQFQNRDHNGRRGGRRAFGDDLVNALSTSTGVDAAKVRSALQSLMPPRGDRHGARDDIRQKLATALGVTTAQLQTATDKVRTDTRNAFATELAQKLNIDVQKVQDVLKDFPGPGRHHG